MILKNALLDHPTVPNFKFLFACYEVDRVGEGRDEVVKESLLLPTEKKNEINLVFEIAYVDLPPSLQKKLSDEIDAGVDTNVCFRIFNLINGHLIAEKDIELNELVYMEEANWDPKPPPTSQMN